MSTEIYHGPHTEGFLEEIRSRIRSRNSLLFWPQCRSGEIGYVVGNGESRKYLLLEILQQTGPVYGCNALYRDFSPDVLFAMDPGMVWEVKEVGYPGDFIYRDPTVNMKLRVHKTDELLEDFGWAAGPTALQYMCTFNPEIKTIYLAGFDLYGINGKVNNMYKDTPCYSTSDLQETYYKGWVKSLATIFELNPGVQFVRVGGVTNDNPELWKSFKNVDFIDMERFWSKVNEFFSSIIARR